MKETPTLILPRHPDWCAWFERAWRAWTAALAPVDVPARLAYLLADDASDAETAHDAALARLAADVALSPAELLRLILRDVLGLRQDGDALRWHLLAAPPCGIRHLPLSENVVSLHALEDTGSGLAVEVDTARPLFLDIETVATSFRERLPAGRSRLLLTHLDRTDVRRAEP